MKKQKSIVSAFSTFFLKNLFPKKKFKISLAEWSLHKSIQSGEMSNMDFPRIARTQFDIGAVEYVSVLFETKTSVEDTGYLIKLKKECEKYHVKSNLIMVDGEGNMGDVDLEKRNTTVTNHFKWVKAARFLGCHSIRVNAAGEGSPEEVQNAVIDGLSKLCNFASQFNINVIVENHGGNSSNPDWLIPVIKKVNKRNCGLLPDFGNFEKKDRYQAVEKMMPYSKGVSAKSFDFDSLGNETEIDYRKMLNIVKKSGYKSYIGIEFEGERLTENEGIKATMKLINDILN
jgi:sugar phosphate isomerase/epimerase